MQEFSYLDTIFFYFPPYQAVTANDGDYEKNGDIITSQVIKVARTKHPALS